MVSSESPPSRVSCPSVGRTKPPIRRNRDDLPTPLGPVTTSASPAPTAKLSFRNTWRPPRTQARSVAESLRIGFTGFIRGTDPKLPPILLTSVDFLERRKKRPYKPSRRAPYQPARCSRPNDEEALKVFHYPTAAPSR